MAPTLMAIICAVMVVPILEPITTQIHLCRFIKPAFIKPMSITVIALDDCRAAVTPMPTSTALSLLFVSFSNISLSFDPAASSSESDKTVIPKRNKASPPAKDNQFEISILTFSFDFIIVQKKIINIKQYLRKC